MASLSLRAYLQKIENLIERGQTEESIAHCKHILNKFPKHVDTYRLLGKSYLEMQRYQEASDVLQRVLSVSPDDFVAQIGMSIIREDSENLDEAIWHMERAFEIQPSNNAVQDELKRLYGRRDGAVPQKILLTRGALVRMYVRGEAYPQAIAEGIAALKEDPLRPDIQLLLAKSYLRTNQINEGYQICQKILESLPFSYEANQLIAEIHILTKQSEQAEPYLERVRMLDPYAAFVNENAPTSAKVDQNAIIIEELNYDAMAATLEAAETSNGTVYIEDDFDTSSLEIPTPGDSQPIELDEDFSWMKDIMDGVDSIQDEQPSAPISQAPVSETPESKENIPAAPTSDDSDEFDVEALFSEDSSADDDAFEALFSEISQNAISESSAEASPPIQPQAAAEQEPMTMAEFFESSSPENEAQNTDAEFAALFAENASSDTETTQTEDDALTALADEMVASTDQPVHADKIEPSAEPVIQEMDLATPPAEDEAIFQSEAPLAEEQISAPTMGASTDASDEELPDWLKELDQESKDADIEGNLQKEIDSLFTNGDLPTAESIQPESSIDANLDDEEEFTAKFLEELENEPQHPGKTRMFSMTADLSSGDSGPLPPLPEDVVPADKTAEDDLPDWLKQLEEHTDQFSADAEAVQSPEPVEPPAVSKSIDAMTEEEEDRLREQFKSAQQPVNATPMPTEEDDDGFAWLESLAAKQTGDDSASIPTTESPVDELPVESPVPEFEEKPAVAASSSSIDAMTEEEEEQLRAQFRNAQPTNAESPINSDDDDDSFAWLESLAAKQTASDVTDEVKIEAAPLPEIEDLPSVEHIEEPVQTTVQEPVKNTTSSTIDSMTEEEEEQLREKFKTSHQTGQLKQTVSENEDDSFAWLESLAAKQGASEESLLTDETDRTSDTPEWLQEMPSMIENNEPVSEAVEPIEEQPVTISKLEQAEILDETGPHTLIEEPIWVDEFATTEPETIEQAQTIDANSMMEEADSRLDLEIEAAIDEAIPILQDSVEETTTEELVQEEKPVERVIAAPATPDEIPDWLKDLEDQTSIYAFSDEEKAKQDIASIDDVEIPGWIADVNETLQIEVEDDTGDDSDLIPDVHAESFITAEDTTEEDQSAEAFEAVGLNIGELEKQLAEENIIEHVNGEKVSEPVEVKQEPELHIPEPVISEPVAQEPVLQKTDGESIPTEQPAAEGEAEEIIFDIPSDFVDEILQEPEPTGPVMPISEDDTEQFAVIRNYLSSDKISEALTIADELIDKEVYLENIIEELNKAIVDHPLDPAIFIRLGDAYIRNNQIQKALDMYQEAETLLQK
jgi:tetratricopeptide (TPR) repeat protein